jgi:hemerythrin-like domain-containing protein
MTTESLADARDMAVVHTMFRRQFGLMPGLVRAVAAGDSTRAALVADHIVMMSDGLATHHQGEDDQIWPRLRERCPADCAPLVDVMEEQHRAIHDRLGQVKEAARSWRHTAPAGARDALAEAIEPLLVVISEHLALEEERVVPLIEKYLTQSEYALAARESAAAVDPGELLIAFGTTIYDGGPGAMEVMMSHVPAGQRPAIEERATRAYAAYAEKLYGTATPPRERI